MASEPQPGARPPALILASASPRRRELLRLAGVSFEAVATAAPELSAGDPAEVVVENARRKAGAGAERAPAGTLVLGADTEVAIDGRTLGKPADAREAEERLRGLFGRTHVVLGAIVLLGPGPGAERTALERSSVTFVELDERLLATYLASGEWRDRAGGYAVQGLGASLIAAVEGDLANVIGLPLRALMRIAPELFS